MAREGDRRSLGLSEAVWSLGQEEKSMSFERVAQGALAQHREEIVMRPIAAIIVVVFGVCSITTAARAESSTCKYYRDQQQACTKNYSAKTCKTEYDICMKSCQKK